MFGIAKIRLVEIGVTLLLTIAAILLVGVTVGAAELAQIEIADAWVRPTVGESKASAAYMTISNKGEADDLLKSAHTPKAKSVELHETTMSSDGVMRMRKVEGGLPIGAGASLMLKPGGAHFMLQGLESALKTGEQMVLTLEFAKAGDVNVVVPVSAGAP
jgi:copper(I)-binding protein